MVFEAAQWRESDPQTAGSWSRTNAYRHGGWWTRRPNLHAQSGPAQGHCIVLHCSLCLVLRYEPFLLLMMSSERCVWWSRSRTQEQQQQQQHWRGDTSVHSGHIRTKSAPGPWSVSETEIFKNFPPSQTAFLAAGNISRTGRLFPQIPELGRGQRKRKSQHIPSWWKWPRAKQLTPGWWWRNAL